jgi:hypothetical protein
MMMLSKFSLGDTIAVEEEARQNRRRSASTTSPSLVRSPCGFMNTRR